MRKVLPFILPLFRTILFISGGLLFSYFSNQTLENSLKYWPLLCTIYNFLTIIVLVLVCRYEKIKYSDLLKFDVKRLKLIQSVKHIFLMLLIGFSGMIGLSIIFYNGLPEFLIKPIIPALAITNLVFLPITIVLAEMPLYFGYSLKKINENSNKKYFGLFTLFSFMHSNIVLFLCYLIWII